MHYSDPSSPLKIPDNQYTGELKIGFQSLLTSVNITSRDGSVSCCEERSTGPTER